MLMDMSEIVGDKSQEAIAHLSKKMGDCCKYEDIPKENGSPEEGGDMVADVGGTVERGVPSQGGVSEGAQGAGEGGERSAPQPPNGLPDGGGFKKIYIGKLINPKQDDGVLEEGEGAGAINLSARPSRQPSPLDTEQGATRKAIEEGSSPDLGARILEGRDTPAGRVSPPHLHNPPTTPAGPPPPPPTSAQGLHNLIMAPALQQMSHLLHQQLISPAQIQSLMHHQSVLLHQQPG